LKRFTIPSPEQLRSNLARWFRERIDLEPVVALAAKKTVPVHRHGWIYLLGGAALFLFGLQVATGALLLLYYHPTEAGAHQSVQRIMAEVPAGSLVRSVHAWGADFFIAVVGLHFLVKLFTRAYRKPREMTWLSGMLLLAMSLAFGFSGYLLPWNELSYNATLVGTQMPGTVPVVGDWVVQFLRGGQYVTGDTITRFFAAHVMLLPLAFGGFLAIHLGLIQAQGMSLPLAMPKKKVRDAMPFFSEFLLIDACLWLAAFGAIVTLATLLPAAVGVKADPQVATPEGTRPEWYFLFMFQTLKYVPEAIGLLLFSLAAVFFTVLPWLDRKAMREERSPGLTVLFALLLACAATLESWAMAVPGVEHAHTQPAAGDLVALGLLWTAIGFLIFYLHQLRKANTQVRRQYH